MLTGVKIAIALRMAGTGILSLTALFDSYYRVAVLPGTIGEMWFGVHSQRTEHHAGSHGRRASRSAGAGPATSRIVPWPNIPKMTYATEIANTGASPGA
jgi:hypothetical protein